jgi:ArsR family transcriptional regulator, arsenate/arsenite/antimonite-responsive transcriptional repressor / arsenate reductase (thioredoxin)
MSKKLRIEDYGLPPFIKLLADQTRWRIVQELRTTDRQVGELAAAIGIPQNALSYHLRLLRQAGILTLHRSDADARIQYYGLNRTIIRSLYTELADHLLLGTPQTSHTTHPPVIFLCTKNSARSQMAEGWLRHLSNGTLRVRSAGTHPSPIHPLAIEAMHEVGIDIGHQSAKGIEALAELPGAIVITVCDVAREAFPDNLQQAQHYHWSIPDPVQSPADIQQFRQVCSLLHGRVEGFLAAMPGMLA